MHAKGGFIFCQLWHVGRATVPSFIEGKQAVGASNIPISGNALDGSEYAASPPRAMTVEEIQNVVEEYATASKRAIEAGFDGVEVHGRHLCSKRQVTRHAKECRCQRVSPRPVSTQ